MYYAYIHNDQIFLTLNKPNVDHYIIIDNTINLNDLYIENNQIKIKNSINEDNSFDSNKEVYIYELLKKFNEFIDKKYHIFYKYHDLEKLSFTLKFLEAKNFVENHILPNLILNELKLELNRDPTNEEILNRCNLVIEKFLFFSNLQSKICSIRRKIENIQNYEEYTIILNQIEDGSII